MSIHSGPYDYTLSLKSNIKIAAIGDLFTIVNGK